MTAAMVLARIEAAGGIAALRPDGMVVISNISRLPPELMEEARRHREAVGVLVAMRRGFGSVRQDPAAFLLHWAGDALAALAGPELGPVLEVGEVDHDDAERAALAEHYAEPVVR